MKVRSTFLAAALAATAVTSMAWGFAGPDLVVCRIGGTSPTNGFRNVGVLGGIRAFAADSVICNYGDVPSTWYAGPSEPDNNHPVISQTIYRLRNGRLTQIGQSWVKHGGFATQATECGLTCTPASGGPASLGVGCCDAYSALTNASQFVGPKSEVNPVTAFFPYPFCSPQDGGMNCPAANPPIDRLLQVNEVEIDTTTPGVQYFFQMHVITPDEVNVAIPKTDMNNVSYRPMSFGADKNISNWNGPTVSTLPAIKAWKLNGLGPGISDPNVVEAQTDIPSDGRFYFAAKATNLGNGLWQYEYAVQNYNSDRAGQAFSMSLPLGHALQNVFFRDIDSHSGEPYSNVDWALTILPTSVNWATTPHAVDPSANALRWDTLYNFRFQSPKPPKSGVVTLSLFKPPVLLGEPSQVSVVLPIPDSDCNANGVGDATDISQGTSLDVNADGVPDECQSPCPADINGNGAVDVADLLAVITAWGRCAVPTSCPADVAPPEHDGVVNVSDLLSVITNWGACPPPI